jgi:Domain of unknown function (DUF3291)
MCLGGETRQSKESSLSHHLALYTFGQFAKPSVDSSNDGFHLRNDPILALVDNTPGLVARSGYEGDPGPASWGTQVYPRFFVDNGDGWAPSTLSLWRDLESALAFSYFGLHKEALSHGRDWFIKGDWPPYVLWWVTQGSRPTWADAIIRHEHLHDHGPTHFAFSFKSAFNALGIATKANAAVVKRTKNHV